jgi:tyrosyl-tRNA synthetase
VTSIVRRAGRVADWFAQLNNKMGGDLKKIQVVGQYMVEVWKAVGMDLTNVEFLSSSEEINKRPGEYWTLVMDIARKNNLKRILRCSQIMGRSETEDLSAAQIFYPCMQCADIFFLKVGGLGTAAQSAGCPLEAAGLALDAGGCKAWHTRHHTPRDCASGPNTACTPR